METGNIVKYQVDNSGTWLVVHLPHENKMDEILEKHIKTCGIVLDDGRRITALQRKKIYATLADISLYTGHLPEELKEIFKYYHIMKTGCEYFSLSTCSIDTAREFINTIIEYCLYNGVQLEDSALNRTDDIGRYLFYCLEYKKCAICGQNGETHHVDAIGMGNDRTEVNDDENEKICLCRVHHTEAHKIGWLKFSERYKVYGIKYIRDRKATDIHFSRIDIDLPYQ